MCGRYNVVPDAEALLDAFGVLINEMDEYKGALYNVAPTSTVPIVLDKHDSRTLTGAHWGLVPQWASDKKMAFRMINARAETIAEKPSFRSPVQKSRCIVPVSGWYEWRKEGAVKQPYYFKTGETLGLAGIFTWNAQLQLLSCSIITTEANPVAADIHHRMPVILAAQNYEQWLDRKAGYDSVEAYLKPYTGNDLGVSKVSTRVNNARYKESDVLEVVP
jgi:putative SOS response-associated peptidase YedK